MAIAFSERVIVSPALLPLLLLVVMARRVVVVGVVVAVAAVVMDFFALLAVEKVGDDSPPRGMFPKMEERT